MKSKTLPAIIVIVSILLIYALSRSIGPEALEAWVKDAGIFGPFVIIILASLTGIIAPLSGTPVGFAGFILYGPRVVFLMAISTIIDAAINFYIARRWGRPLIARFVGKEDTATIDNFTREHGLTSLFLMRMFLTGMHDFVSYAMGLTNINFSAYLLVTVLGVIPGTFISYAIALQSNDPFVFVILMYLFAGIFTAVYLLYKFVMKLEKKQK